MCEFQAVSLHHLVCLCTFQSLLKILELCSECGYTPREGERKKRERKRDKGKVGACVKSQQRSEGGPMGATHPYARRPPPALLGARGLVAPPWFPPPTIPSSFTNHGVPLASDSPSCSVHEIHSHTHFLHMHNNSVHKHKTAQTTQLHMKTISCQ